MDLVTAASLSFNSKHKISCSLYFILHNVVFTYYSFSFWCCLQMCPSSTVCNTLCLGKCTTLSLRVYLWRWNLNLTYIQIHSWNYITIMVGGHCWIYSDLEKTMWSITPNNNWTDYRTHWDFLLPNCEFKMMISHISYGVCNCFFFYQWVPNTTDATWNLLYFSLHLKVILLSHASND